MPSKWDDTTEKQMLLALLQVVPLTKANFVQAASVMNADFSGEALRQKYMKMKKTIGGLKSDGGADGEDEGEGGGKKNGAKTPVKRGGTKKGDGEGKKSGGGGKRKANKEEEGEDDDQESPSKKVKAEESESDDLV